MKKIFKGKIGTVIILVITFILAGVAIFTAIRLYQLRNQAVAPNVPSSVPQAHFNSTPPPAASCDLSFTVTPLVPGLNCTGKFAYSDSAQSVPDNYQLDEEIPAGSVVSPEETFVYTITYENTGTGAASSAIITDVLPSNLDFVDADSDCTYESSTKTVTCDLGSVAAGVSSQKSIRVKVESATASGGFVNNAIISADGVEDSECEISLDVQISTPTPTPTTTPTTTPSSTPNSCNGTCGSDINCDSGFTCSGGFCRNPSCPAEESCSCPGTSTSTPAPTTPALPQSGTDWPTVMGAGLGIFIIIGSLLLAL